MGACFPSPILNAVPYLNLWYVANPGTTFTNVDGTINHQRSTRIPSALAERAEKSFKRLSEETDSVAERVGFEPTVPFGIARLPSRPIASIFNLTLPSRVRPRKPLRLTPGGDQTTIETCCSPTAAPSVAGCRRGPAIWRESMEMALTAVFKKVPEGYIAFVEELPGANTQGATLEEARENLREAAELVLEANRALAQEEVSEGEVIREPLKIAAG